MSHVKTIEHEFWATSINSSEATVLNFGSQMHLVFSDSSEPREIFSWVLEITSASESCKVQKVIDTQAHYAKLSNTDNSSVPKMGYVHHIFDKYAISPAFQVSNQDKCHNLSFHLLWRTSSSVIDKDLGDRCRWLLESSLKKLEKDKGKDFHDLEIHFHMQTLEESLLQNPCMTDSQPAIGMADWMWHVVCLVPIQIARAENNTFAPCWRTLHLLWPQLLGHHVTCQPAPIWTLWNSTGELDWRCKSNILHGKTEQQKVSPADSLEWLAAGCGRWALHQWCLDGSALHKWLSVYVTGLWRVRELWMQSGHASVDPQCCLQWYYQLQ